MPSCIRGSQPQHVAGFQSAQPTAEVEVLPVEAVSHHGPERKLQHTSLCDQLQGDLQLSSEGRVALSSGKPVSRRVGLEGDGPVEDFVGLEAVHQDDTLVDFVNRTEILPVHVSRLGAPRDPQSHR